ncbi:MAG: hypothetical protein GXP54_03550 [Deltaproteobacteria bacterium]|nr:hypothetical protein [Deltaproteobacteria bacterium]
MSGQTRFALGDEIDIYCRWCRLNMNGVVSALDEKGDVAKVQCRTCRNFLPFKPPKDMAAEKRRLLDKALKMREGQEGRGDFRRQRPKQAVAIPVRGGSGPQDVG